MEIEEKQGDQNPAPQKPHSCIYCYKNIHPKASKCHECGSYQKRYKNWLAYIPLIISAVMLFIAFAQVILGYIQMREAKQKQIAATETLKRATEAESIARSAVSKTENLYQLAKKRVDDIELLLNETKATINELKFLNEFTLILIKAQNDNRQAYDQLIAWGSDKSFRYHQLARSAEVSIRQSYYEKKWLPFAYLDVFWKEGKDSMVRSFDEIVSNYNITPTSNHVGVVELIWKENDIPKKERIQFLVYVLQNDTSLRAVYLAGLKLSEETGILWDPFIIEPFLKWWEKNKKGNAE